MSVTDNVLNVTVKTLCLCQQSFKSKCSQYNDSLREIQPELAPAVVLNEPEIKLVYETKLDELNSKYERLLSLFQELLDNTKDIDADREVSHFLSLKNCFFLFL
jgi:hypothetical protein